MTHRENDVSGALLRLATFELRIEAELAAGEQIEGETIPLVDFWEVSRSAPFDFGRFISGRCEALGGTYTP